MRHGNFADEPGSKINWRIVNMLSPYLFVYKGRVLLALLCLILSKGAILFIPFLLKYLVDALDSPNPATIASSVIAGLVIAIGVARFSNVLFGELRDTIFGRVTERAMRFIGLDVFRHMHRLDLDFHLNRRTGGLARDIERGTTGISFLMRFFVFNIAPTLFEIAMVIGILLLNYGYEFAVITFFLSENDLFHHFSDEPWRDGHPRYQNGGRLRYALPTRAPADPVPRPDASTNPGNSWCIQCSHSHPTGGRLAPGPLWPDDVERMPFFSGAGDGSGARVASRTT